MAKAPAALAAAAPAASSIAKLAMPASLSTASMLSRMAPAASSVAKIPMKGIMDAGMDKVLDNFTKKPGWLERNKDGLRNAGLGLMQMGMQQQQQQAAPMQLTPFQPSAGGGGMPGGQGGQGALMQLLQQYGMNKIQ